MLLIIVLCALATWFALSVPAGVLVGRSIAAAGQGSRRMAIRPERTCIVA